MKGVYAAIVTHFDQELNVDAGALGAEINRLVAAGVHGIVPNGTVGEGGSLSREERRTVIEICVGVTTGAATAGGQASVCAGVSAATAEQAGAYARDARSAGADSVMALPPLLYRADRRELVEFFGQIARAADLPLMVYNNPMSSGSDLEPGLLAELVHEIPAIAAIKETSGDARRIAELVNLLPEIDIMVGGDDWALEGFCTGAAGWISGVVDVFPAECVRLWELCLAGDLSAARALYADLLPLARLDMTPKLVQYFKAALDEIGIGGGPCRPPRLPLTDDEHATLRQAVAHGLAGAVGGR
jgi:dihydrodipicolinate synthase/N-acetylneuraminate lyase